VTRSASTFAGLRKALALLTLSLAWAGPGAVGAQGAPEPTAAVPDAAPASPSPAAAPYANTPAELRPFSRFVAEPYSRFFEEPLPYNGPWRDKPVPPLESLATVRIGLLTPLERSHEAYLGRAIHQGVELALLEANAQGGYQGKPFELVLRNDTGLWGASANEVVHFAYDEHVWAILGTVDGANTHIAIRVALKIEIPMVNVGDLDPTLVETRIPWVFRVVPDDRQQAYTLAFYLYRQLGLKQVAVIRANNRYGRFGVAEFLRGSTRMGVSSPIEVNYETSWERSNPDFALQVERIAKVKPEAVVLWADAKPAGRLVQRLRAAGLTMPIFGCDRIVHPDFLAEAGAAAEGTVAVTPFDPQAETPGLKAFRERYRARYGAEPDSYAAHAYDGAWMTVAAIREGGLNWARIRDALAAGQDVAGITGDIRFDGALANRRRVTLATARGGAWRYGEPKAEVRF